MALKTPEKNEEETGLQPSSIPAEQLERIPTASQEDINQLRAGHTKPGPDGTANNGSSYINDGGVKFNDTSYDPTRFKPNETRGVYDGETNPLKDKEQGTYGKQLSGKDLKNKEEQGSSESGDASTDEEKAKLENKSGLFSGNEEQSTFGKFRAKITGTSRKKLSILAVAGVLSIVGIGGFSYIQGPLQFIHLSQNLQKIFRNNEDFGNDRMSRVLLYALAGKGFENSRLGVSGNIAADQWEKKLLNDTGLRPVYSDPGRKFVGFEVVDEQKATNVLEELGLNDEGSRSQRTANQSVQEAKVELINAGEMTDKNGNKVNYSNSNKTRTNNRVVSTVKADYKVNRAWIKVISKSTDTYNIVGSQGARLLIKRAGVSYHPMNKISKWTEEQRNNYRKKRADSIRNGAEDVRGITVGQNQDSEGNNTDPDPGDVEVSEEAKELVENFKAGKFVRAGAAAAAGPAAITGVLCMVKQYGNSIPDYKFTNIAKPMMRIGVEAVSAGDQVKSFDDFNLNSMGVLVEYLQDRENNSSWSQSEAYQASLGKEGGIKPPPEMELRNINEKPLIFEQVDSIPGLATACKVSDGFFNLPVIKQIAGVVDEITGAFIGVALNAFGTSQDELLESSLKIVAGQNVDPEKTKGAAYGNASFIGTELAANDVAIAMGGSVMTNQEAQQLALLQEDYEIQDNQDQSFFARYLDPVQNESLVASIVNTSPSNKNQLLSLLANPLNSIGGFAQSTLALATPDANAQSRILVDYGFKRYGFTLSERTDAKFEDPYENASIVESQLEDLNNKYSECFGIKVVEASDGGVMIENAESVNIFKFEENGGDGEEPCDRPSKNSEDYEMFLRYRFYIADTVSVLSVNCYYDEDCYAIDSGTSSDSTNTDNQAVGEINMKETITLSSPGKFITLPSKYSCPGRTTRIDSRIAPALTYILETYRMCADDGLANGHRSHGAGLGVDIRPKDQSKQDSREEWINTAEASLIAINWWGDSATDGRSDKGCATYSGYGSCTGGNVGPNGPIPQWVRWIGYNGDVDHGDPWHVFGGSYAHIHLGWDTPNKDGVSPTIISSPVSEVYTFPAPIFDDIKPLLSTTLIDELESKGGIVDVGSGGAPVSGSTRELAKQILSNPRISYPLDSQSENGSTKFVLEELAAGRVAPVTCRDGSAGGVTTANLKPEILKFLVELGNRTSIGVNSLTDKCHTSGSNHYRGIAVDFECEYIKFDTRIADPIAQKYGGKRNFETCVGNNHWHYDF